MREFVGSRLIFAPGVRAVIPNDQGEVLLQQRRDTNLWGLPGGAVELDETALEGLKREVTEETGLTVLRAEPMALYSGLDQRFTYPNGDQIQCFALAFIVREWMGKPQADGVEGAAVRFFSRSALPDDVVPIHRKTLEDYFDYKGTFLVT